MLLLSSPSKTQIKYSYSTSLTPTIPEFLATTSKIYKKLSTMNDQELMTTLSISSNIAAKTKEYYLNWKEKHTIKNSTPAIFLYRGDIYKKMNIENYTDQDLEYAENSFRIISAFYGLLSPLDLIQNYRLEFSSSIKINGKNLYEVWRDILTSYLNSQIQRYNHDLILNLASKEYSKAINFHQLNSMVFHVDFKEKRGNKLKTIAIYAKQARGLMIDYCIKKKVKTLDDLKNFNKDGYSLQEITSNNILFTR